MFCKFHRNCTLQRSTHIECLPSVWFRPPGVRIFQSSSWGGKWEAACCWWSCYGHEWSDNPVSALPLRCVSPPPLQSKPFPWIGNFTQFTDIVVPCLFFCLLTFVIVDALLIILPKIVPTLKKYMSMFIFEIRTFSFFVTSRCPGQHYVLWHDFLFKELCWWRFADLKPYCNSGDFIYSPVMAVGLELSIRDIWNVGSVRRCDKMFHHVKSVPCMSAVCAESNLEMG